MRSWLVPRLFLKTTSGLLLVTRSLNRSSDRLMVPSAGPLAPSVFSDTFGTCCLKTSGVILWRPRRCPEPRPGLHGSTPTTLTVTRTNTALTNIAGGRFARTNGRRGKTSRRRPAYPKPLLYRNHKSIPADSPIRNCGFLSEVTENRWANVSLWNVLNNRGGLPNVDIRRDTEARQQVNAQVHRRHRLLS